MVEVLVVAPVRVHRESLSTVLNEAQGLSVVGTAATVAEALPRLRSLAPHVAVLDAAFPEDVDVPSRAIAEAELKLVAVGVRGDEAVDWIEAGVSGCVPPDASLEDLARAVEGVGRGELVTPVDVTPHLIERIRRLASEGPRAAGEARLTPRQAEVLDLVAKRLSNRQIAQRLSIEEQTVKNHMVSIFRKLGVHRRSEAAERLRRTNRRSSDR